MKSETPSRLIALSRPVLCLWHRNLCHTRAIRSRPHSSAIRRPAQYLARPKTRRPQPPHCNLHLWFCTRYLCLLLWIKRPSIRRIAHRIHRRLRHKIVRHRPGRNAIIGITPAAGIHNALYPARRTRWTNFIHHISFNHRSHAPQHTSAQTKSDCICRGNRTTHRNLRVGYLDGNAINL